MKFNNCITLLKVIIFIFLKLGKDAGMPVWMLY